MTVTLHKNIPIADNHSMVKYSCATATVRRALTGCIRGEVAEQTDTVPATLWAVIAGGAGTATWSRMDTGAEVTVTGPLAIMAGSIRAGYSGDVGLTTTAWQDQGPGAHHMAGTCAVAAAALGGKNCCQTNGTTHDMHVFFSIPAPGTSPSYIYTIARNDTGGGFAVVVGLESANGLCMLKDGVTEICLSTSGGLAPRHVGGFTVGSFKRARCLFTGTGTDKAQVGSGSELTATPLGNTAGTGVFIGTTNGQPSATTYAEIWVFSRDVTPTELTALDAWASTKYGTTFP